MPASVRPAANARVPYLVTFEWSEVAGATGYVIQVAEEESFSAPLLVDDTVAATAFEVALPVIGPLWWRVRALDTDGAPGPWSPARKFDIIPPPMASSVAAISLNPSSVAGGAPAEGVITLVEPAPREGATVLLSTSNPEKALVPARVLFAEGETAAPFRIATAPVAAETDVRISVRGRGAGQSATLAIAPYRASARLSSLVLKPAVLAAGSGAQGTVTLSAPAPASTVVRLSTSDSARTLVPPAVTIPSGGIAAHFPVETAHDTASGAVLITASVDGETRTASLNLRGAAAISPLPAPTQISPTPGAAVLAPFEFAWSDVTGAVSYTIEVYHSGSFDGPVAASRTVPASRITISPIAPGTVWWRVRANDSNGAPGRWSPARPLQLK